MKKIYLEIVRNRAKKLVTKSGMNYQIQYRARIRAANGEIVFVSETYKTRAGAKKAVSFVLGLAESFRRGLAEIKEINEAK